MSKPTKVPGISKPPANLAPDVKRYLETLAEAVEIRLGRRGDKRDRAITLRELIESGLAVDLKSTPFDPNNLNGGNLGFAPNDILDTNVPPAPLNFQAAGAYSQVNLSWDFPRYSNHAFTEIYGHDSDAIGDAQLIAVSAGRGTSDPVGSGVSRYYWARFVSTSGIIGPWNNSSGTLATTAPDVEHLLGVLNGAITSSELATSLSTPIGNLPANTALEISNEAAARAADLATEATNRAAAIAASATVLQGQIDDLLDIDVYDNASTYALGDQVTYDGKLYKALQASTGNLPTNTTYWNLLGNYTSLGDAVGSNTAAITEINTVSAGSGSATARALHGLQVTVNDGATGLVATRASLLNDYYTSASVDSAIASATSTLVATSTLADYTTTAGLVQNYYTKTAADSAISSATQDLVSTTGLATELGNYTTTAGLTQNYYTKTDADSAISSATQDLVSTTGLATELGNYTTTAGLSQNYYTKTATDSAISSATQDLVSTTTLGNYTTTAGLSQNYYTKTATDSAISSATQDLVSTTTLGNYTTTAGLSQNYYTKTATDSAISSATQNLVSNTTLANYTTTAGLNQNYYTKTATDNAIAGAITTLSSGFDDPDGGAGVVTLQQAMTTQADINGTLKSSYAVKIDANGAVAGFGLASTTNALGVNESEFIINADRFALMRGGSNTAAAVTPFVVQANDTTINGTLVPAGVYMDAAFIKTAAIQSAQIGSVNADTITTGTLNVTELIEANAINASQLNLVGTGTLINLQSASNGSRMQILSDAIKVFDGNTLRVQLGNLSA